MKKKLIAMAVCCVFVALGLTGCGSSMSYDDYELSEYLKAGEYKGLKTAPYAVSVVDTEVEAQILKNLDAAAEDKKMDKSTAIVEGDTANIDYVGKVNGKKFEGGSAKGYDLVIGSGSFIDGFEDGLLGKKSGETVDLNLKFPDDYQNEDMKGKEAVFTVKINSVTRRIVPELNNEFVKKNSKYKTVDEYKKAVEKQLYDKKEAEAVNKQKTDLWSKALDNAEIKKYPDRELKHYIKFNSEQIDEAAKTYGMTREEVLAKYEFGNEEEFAAVNEDSSKVRVKQELLIMYIAEKEKLTYTDAEKEALVQDFKGQGFDADAIEKQTGRTLEDYVHIELLYQKVLDLLLENAKISGAAFSE